MVRIKAKLDETEHQCKRKKILKTILTGFTDVRIHWKTPFEESLETSKSVIEEIIMEAVRNTEISVVLDDLVFQEVRRNGTLVRLLHHKWKVVCLSSSPTSCKDSRVRTQYDKSCS